MQVKYIRTFKAKLVKAYYSGTRVVESGCLKRSLEHLKHKKHIRSIIRHMIIWNHQYKNILISSTKTGCIRVLTI